VSTATVRKGLKNLTAEKSFDGEAFLKRVGNSPGVYVMQDCEGHSLYVGKAKDLRKRLASYFGKRALPAKTELMVSQISNIKIITTHTESEALLLENNLIKEKKPRYNVIFKDDKSYPYIRVTTHHPYPGISFYRGSLKRSGLFFGPYANIAAVREILGQLQKIIPVRHCSNTYFSNRSRACLQYQIKRCSGPCVGLIDPESYREDIRQIIMLLQGRSDLLSELFQKEMRSAAQVLDYERAANYRNRISALREIQSRQGNLFPIDYKIDVVTALEQNGTIVISVASIRLGQNPGDRHYIFRPLMREDAKSVLSSFLPQFYLRHIIPKEIVIAPPLKISKGLTSLLSEKAGHKVLIKVNVRGKRAEALAVSMARAEEYLFRHLASKENYEHRFASLCDDFTIDKEADRIECYDISHMGGESTVASQVVFKKDGPTISEYRRFNIKEAAPGDDYGALEEALVRRFRMVSEEKLRGTAPSILLVDGGKGQLRLASRIINALAINNVCLASIAKGRNRNPNLDRVYIYTNGRVNRVLLSRTSMHFVQEIRDEAHRFAITGHRSHRSKKRMKSTLENIAGIGTKRRQSLLLYFGGLKSIEKAGIDEIARVKGISAALARNIYRHFHS